jgi:hypothetical protein
MEIKVDYELERVILLMMHTPTVSDLLYGVCLSVIPKNIGSLTL